MTSPSYPNQSISRKGVDFPGQPSVAYQDFPTRYPYLGAESWQAELGLVCLDPTKHTASILESFLWGFGVTNGSPGTIDNITSSVPGAWGWRERPTSSTR